MDWYLKYKWATLSQRHRWKIKKYTKLNGNFFFKVYRKGLMGVWMPVQHYTGYEVQKDVTLFDTKEEAEKTIENHLLQYSNWIADLVNKVEDI